MKILLVNPNQVNPFSDLNVESKEDFLKQYYPSLGINLLGTILKNNGHEVIALDHLYQYLRTECKSPINLYEGVEDILRSSEIDLVGISMITNTRKASLDIAKIAKKFGKPVVIGGPHSVMCEQLLENYPKIIDYVVVGGGEQSFLKLVNNISEGKMDDMEGVAFNKDGKIIFSENKTEVDLNSLPSIDYDEYAKLMPEKKLDIISMFTSKGCPFNCTFCAHYWGNKCRAQTADKIFEDVKNYVEKYKIKSIRFEDDSFTLDKKRTEHFFDLLIESGIKIEIDLFTRFDGIDHELLEKFKQAGGRSISLGVETGSERLRKLMNKNITDDQIYEKVEIIKELGLDFYAYLMFGYPGENIDDIKKTYKMMEKIKPTGVNCTITQIDAPNTPLFDLAKKEGKISKESWLEEDVHRFYFAQGEDLKKLYGIKLLFEKKFNDEKHWKQYDWVVPYISEKMTQDDIDKLLENTEKLVLTEKPNLEQAGEVNNFKIK